MELTKREKEMYEKMTDSEYRAIVIQTARIRLKGEPMCSNHLTHLKKGNFESDVSTIVNQSHGWF